MNENQINQQPNVNQQVIVQPQNNNSNPMSNNIQTEFGKKTETKKNIKMKMPLFLWQRT